MKTPVYDVEYYFHFTQHLRHESKILTGLVELAEDGVIQLKLRHTKPLTIGPDDPTWTGWVRVTRREDKATRLVVFEMSDHSNSFSMEALKNCDVYFKRNYYHPDVAELPHDLQAKIRPYGLNYGCRSSRASRLALSHFSRQLLVHALRSPRRAYARRAIHRMNVDQYLRILSVSEYEEPPSSPVERAVVFQPKVIPKSQIPHFEEQIIQPRVELVRRLRSRLGTSFRGGVIPNAFTRRYCADALTTESTRRSDYIQLAKRALIVVYTRGYHNSLAYKLSEYLAASKCIVAEGIRNELPEPLVPGLHYLEFTTPDECVEQCVRLLNDDKLANEMRRNNWDYYRSYVRPPEHLKRCLDRTFETVRT